MQLASQQPNHSTDQQPGNANLQSPQAKHPLAQRAQAAKTHRDHGNADFLGVTNNITVIAAYEEKISKLENEKLIQLEKLDKKAKPKHTIDEIFEIAMAFLSSPWNIWKNGELALRKIVLRLAFKEHLMYDRENGFRTPQVSVMFRFLDDISLKSKMVRLEGERSNSLFEVLEEWERHLTQVDFDSLRCGDEQLRQ